MHNVLLKNKFVILAMPRTGSNMLCSMLNSHCDILCHHELYNPKEIFYALQLRNTDFKLASKRSRNKYPLHFLSKVWSNNLGYKNLGFKMTGKQNTIVLNTLLNDATVKKIILKRHNRVKSFVSKLIAQQCGIWEDYINEPLRERNRRVKVDFDDLQNEISYSDQFYHELENTIEQNGEDYCLVYYESLQETIIQKKLLDFIGASFTTLRAESRKQNPDDLRSIIINYEQLKEKCEEHDFLIRDFN